MTGNPALIAEIRKEIAASGGRITFCRFMELALYHPQFGYYTCSREPAHGHPSSPNASRLAATTNRPCIGLAGDYFTSVSIGPIFGRILARQFQQWGMTDVWEFGGHRGQLRNDILAVAPELNYRVIEVGTNRRAVRDSDGAPGGCALPDTITGAVFSNEFLDALPVHRLCGDREIYVAVGWASRPSTAEPEPADGQDAHPTFTEELGPLSDPRLPRLPDGYRSEINLRALDWLTDISRRLEPGGYVLTIDYGFARAEYFAPHHAAGHLQCYYRHTKSANPYAHIGEQDITAHVEFTSLIEHGRSLGLEPVRFTDQAHYLLEIGESEIAEIVQRDAGRLSRERNALHQLLHSTMGRAFKVLVQSKK